MKFDALAESCSRVPRGSVDVLALVEGRLAERTSRSELVFKRADVAFVASGRAFAMFSPRSARR